MPWLPTANQPSPFVSITTLASSFYPTPPQSYSTSISQNQRPPSSALRSTQTITSFFNGLAFVAILFIDIFTSAILLTAGRAIFILGETTLRLLSSTAMPSTCFFDFSRITKTVFFLSSLRSVFFFITKTASVFTLAVWPTTPNVLQFLSSSCLLLPFFYSRVGPIPPSSFFASFPHEFLSFPAGFFRITCVLSSISSAKRCPLYSIPTSVQNSRETTLSLQYLLLIKGWPSFISVCVCALDPITTTLWLEASIALAIYLFASSSVYLLRLLLRLFLSL